MWFFVKDEEETETETKKPMVTFTSQQIEDALVVVVSGNAAEGKDPWYCRVFSLEDFQLALETVICSKGIGVSIDSDWAEYALQNHSHVTSLSSIGSPNLWIFK
jgi:hypothetical protein